MLFASLVSIATLKVEATSLLENEDSNFAGVLKPFPRPMPTNNEMYETTVKEYFSDIPAINEPSIREAFNSIFTLPEYLAPSDFEYLYNAIGNAALPSDSIVEIINQFVANQRGNFTLSRSGKHHPGFVKKEGIPNVCSDDFGSGDIEEY